MIQKAPPQQIPLGGGLRTDIDPKILPLGNVLELENAIQRQTGQIVNRFGGNALPNTINSLAVPSLTQPAWQLANYKADLIRLQRQGKSPVSRWSPTLNDWAYCGFGDYTNLQTTIQSCMRGPFSTSVLQVSSLSGTVTTADTAIAGGFIFYSFVSIPVGGGTATHILQVNDQATGEMVWRYSVAAGALTQQRLAIVGNFVVMAWVDSTTNQVTALNVDYTTVRNTSPTVVLATGIGATTHATQPWFDMIAFGTTVVMAWRTSTSKTFGAEYTPSTNTHVNYEIKTSASSSIVSLDALGFLQNPGGFVGVGLISCDHTGVGLIVTAGFQGAAVGVSTVTHVLDAAPGLVVSSVTGVFTSASVTAECNVIYSFFQTAGPFGPASDYIRFAEFTGGSTNSAVWCRSIRAISKMFTVNGDNFVVTGYTGSSTTYNGIGSDTRLVLVGIVPPPQSSYFVHRVPTNMLSAPETPGPLVKTPIARLMSTDAAYGPNHQLVSVNVSGSVAITAANRIVQITTEANQTDVEAQCWSITLTANPTLGAAVEAADNLYVPGAQLQCFDGQNYADDGCAVFPEQPIVTSHTGGAMTTTGTYNVCQVYKYTDARGRVGRSAPSLPTTVTLGGTDASIQIISKCLNLTSRELQFGTSISIETYRTGNITGGAAPLLFQLLRVDANDSTMDALTVVDGTASVATGQPLYTTGGVLINDPTPGFSSVATFDNRVWGVSMDFPDTLWYSEQIVDAGALPHWSFSRNLLIQDEHGGITAIKALDDKLVVFKRDAVYAITGQGPDPSGQNDSYVPSLVAIGVGTTNPQSIAVIGLGDAGVVFQSTSQRAGYFLLDRGVSLQYIGAQVQKYMELATAAILVPGQSQMRFYTASGRTLVYDLVGKIWSTFTGQPALHAACWADNYAVYARSATADVVVEDPTGATYTEAGTAYGMHVATPWLQLSGLVGFERFFRIQGVGQTLAIHSLRIRLYQNFDDVNTLTDQSCVPGPLWDWETRYSAKLAALKIVLDVTGTTAGPSMTALALIMGVKAGLRKLPSVNRTT